LFKFSNFTSFEQVSKCRELKRHLSFRHSHGNSKSPYILAILSGHLNLAMFLPMCSFFLSQTQYLLYVCEGTSVLQANAYSQQY